MFSASATGAFRELGRSVSIAPGVTTRRRKCADSSEDFEMFIGEDGRSLVALHCRPVCHMIKQPAVFPAERATLRRDDAAADGVAPARLIARPPTVCAAPPRGTPGAPRGVPDVSAEARRVPNAAQMFTEERVVH